MFKLVDVTNRSGSLRYVVQLEKEMELVYNFLKEHMLEHAPARIVTVSKALLMVAGFSPGFDTRVLEAIGKANPYILAAPGVWPFCLYKEHLEFMAGQQAI